MPSQTDALQQELAGLRQELRLYQNYDLLTRLYNKQTFYQKSAELLREQPNTPFDIVCVDVERFKLINDQYGAETGDKVLCAIAAGLKQAFSPMNAILGRMAGDVFLLCVPGGREQEVEQLILRVFADCPLNRPVLPAIGFCHVTDRTLPINLLCDWAALAMRTAKGSYLKHSAVFNSSQRSLLLEEQTLMDKADAALKNREFQVYFQPKCNMRTGRIVGAEALVRWISPEKGLIPPCNFIPLFERNGFIKKLDLYVWEETIAWLRRRMDAGVRPVPVSVNISRIDIYGMDVCNVLTQLLNHYKVDLSLLELEITESAYVNQPEEIIRTIERLMGHGFTVLMDDFGSGYSSLNMLNNISVDILKIDMRFLARDDRKSRDILESVLHMSKWLNLPVVAEGVETKTQMDFLLAVGCMYAQGYYFYRPMPQVQFEALLADPEKVDLADNGRQLFDQAMLLDFHDLFHKDLMSDRLLSNLLGAIALYSFDGEGLYLLRGTEAYYKLMDSFKRPQAQWEQNLLPFFYEEDHPQILEGLRRAKTAVDDNVVELYVRKHHRNVFLWLQIRLFHLAETGGRDVYYAALADCTEHMTTLERLRVSEEQFCLAMETTSLVLFELDIKKREARYSKYTQRSFDLDAQVVKAPEGFIQQGTVCPESEEDFRAMYEAIFCGAEKASCIIHARLSGGAAVWNRVSLTTVKNNRGQAVKAVGIVETISRETEPSPEICQALRRQAQSRQSSAAAALPRGPANLI